LYDAEDARSMMRVWRDKPDPLLIIGHWYFPLYLWEDLILRYRFGRIVGYLVTEGPVPRGISEMLDRFDALIHPSRFAMSFYGKVVSRGKQYLIPHGVDTSLFRPPEGERRHGVAVVLPSAVSERRGSDIALEVLSRLSCSVVGNVWARQHIGSEKISVVVAERYAEMPRIYGSAKLFLYTSRAEGFGLPVLEAMSCGTVPVYSDAYAHKEFAVGRAVPVVKVEDVRDRRFPVYYRFQHTRPGDYVEAINELLSDPKELEELSHRCREATFRYDYRIVYDDLLGILL